MRFNELVFPYKLKPVVPVLNFESSSSCTFSLPSIPIVPYQKPTDVSSSSNSSKAVSSSQLSSSDSSKSSSQDPATSSSSSGIPLVVDFTSNSIDSSIVGPSSNAPSINGHHMVTRSKAKTNVRRSVAYEAVLEIEPKTVKEALQDPKWVESMKEEYEALIRNGS